MSIKWLKYAIIHTLIDCFYSTVDVKYHHATPHSTIQYSTIQQVLSKK